MPRRYFRKLACLAKVETTYGTDSVPTGAANALLLNDVTLTPLDGEQVSRDLILPYFGNEGFVLAASFTRVEFSIEAAGSGAAGTAPAYAALLRACSLSETLTASTKAEYKPVTANPEAASIYANLDGVNHIMVGARGTVSLSLMPKQIPRFRFVMTGLLGPIADTVLPALTISGFQKPLVVSKTNTTFSLHGLAAVLESFAFDLGNVVEPRMLVNSESIEITDRSTVGSAVIEAVPLATKDWFGIARASTTGALSAVHGTAAGNIVEVAAAAVQIGRPTYGNTQNVLNNTLPLTFVPVAGDDEVALRIR